MMANFATSDSVWGEQRGQNSTGTTHGHSDLFQGFAYEKSAPSNGGWKRSVAGLEYASVRGQEASRSGWKRNLWMSLGVETFISGAVLVSRRGGRKSVSIGAPSPRGSERSRQEKILLCRKIRSRNVLPACTGLLHSLLPAKSINGRPPSTLMPPVTFPRRFGSLADLRFDQLQSDSFTVESFGALPPLGGDIRLQ